jgi:DNA mismatch repair protein MutL
MYFVSSFIKNVFLKLLISFCASPIHNDLLHMINSLKMRNKLGIMTFMKMKGSERVDSNLIQILAENVINKIAAGEVIDRPSSVVKELVENSIDAGANSITIILKDGGKALIQVIDNGIGMGEQDAIMSFQRHATSKISDFNDVEQVNTLGFRGEALASIASVARVELKTIPKNEIEGTQIQIDGGVVANIGRIGGNPGTSIAVKNIFYNTPARRKFLRASSTEYRHILSMMTRFTLAHPSIEFSVFHEDNKVYNLKKAELLPRISEVMGGKIAGSMMPIEEENAVFKMTGYLGNFESLRKSRGDQYFFVNSRYINDRTLAAAVISGYGEILPKGRFPIYALFFELDPTRIDVNVHPTKSEIKFADQHMLFSLVRSAIKRALIADGIIPHVRPEGSGDLQESDPRFSSSLIDDIKNFHVQQTVIDFSTISNARVDEDRTSASQQAAIPSAALNTSITPAAPATSASAGQAMLWQLHNKYVLSQIKSGLVIIDQHAAHERITYERVKARFQDREAPSQQLLFPHTLELSAEDYALLSEMLPFLEYIGFVMKGFGERTIVVEGIPAGMRIRKEEKILPEILDEYKIKIGSEVDMQERVAKSVACRASIMAGDKLTIEEMNALVDQLFACETPYFCPHGRPTMITISMDELDDRFERT